MKAATEDAVVESQTIPPKRRRFGFALPAGVTHNSYLSGLGGALCFAASLGVQAMLTGMALTVVPMPYPIPPRLTDYVAWAYHPEHDISVYLPACGLSILLMLAAAWIFNRHLHALAFADRKNASFRLAILTTLLGGAGMGLYLYLFLARQFAFADDQHRISTAAILFSPALLCVFLLWWTLKLKFSITPAMLSRWWLQQPELLSETPQLEQGKSRRVAMPRYFIFAFDILVAFMICATIYTPDWKNLALHSFIGDYFHHWDFFAMGPALAYSHGAALDTQAYSQYGVAWPLVFVALSKYLPLSYGNMMGVGVIWGCLYFIGVYILLRMLLKNVLLAASGVTIAMHIWLFKAGSLHLMLWAFPSTLWAYPNVTPLRAPLDIWFFISLLQHMRSKRPVWMLTAAVLVGLAMLFITDTGLFLAMTFAFYGAVSSWNLNNAENAESAEISSPSGHRRNYLFLVLGSWVVTFAVFSLGLALASRGTFLHKEFWIGWTETILLFGGGLNQLPLATIPERLALVCFAVIAAGYLWLVGFLLVRLLHRETVANHLLLACMAFYGLMLLLIFVGRSDHVEAYHVSISATILAAGLLERIYGRAINMKTARALLCWSMLVSIIVFFSASRIASCDFWQIEPYVVAGTFLWAIRSSWVRASHREASAIDFVLAGIALIGLAALISWVGRFNYLGSAYPASISFGIVAATLGKGIYQRKSNVTLDHGFISCGLLFGAWITLTGNLQYRLYPNLFHADLAGRQDKTLCLIDEPLDVCSVTPDQAGTVRDFQAVVARMKAAHAGGKTILVIDREDTKFYMAAGMPPWSRYSPLMPSLATQASLKKVTSQMASRPPDYAIFTRTAERNHGKTWRALILPIRQSYVLESRIGAFGIWRHRQGGKVRLNSGVLFQAELDGRK